MSGKDNDFLFDFEEEKLLWLFERVNEKEELDSFYTKEGKKYQKLIDASEVDRAPISLFVDKHQSLIKKIQLCKFGKRWNFIVKYTWFLL